MKAGRGLVPEQPETGDPIRQGRAAFGVTGRSEYGPFRGALEASGLRCRAMVSLGLLTAATFAQLCAVTLLAPEVTRDGLGASRLPLLVRLAGVLCVGLLTIRLVEHGLPRPRLALAAGAVGALGMLVTGLALGSWQQTTGSGLVGASTGASFVLLKPMLMDHYRPEVRLRVFSVCSAFAVAGVAVAVAVRALAEGPLDLTWRGTCLLLAMASMAAVAAALVLDDPPAGRWDALLIARSTRHALGGRGDREAPLAVADVAMGSLESLRLVLALPSARPLLNANLFWGLLVLGDQSYLMLFWEDRWNAGTTTQLWLSSLMLLAAVAGIGAFARSAEVFWRLSPARLVAQPGQLAGAGAVCLVAAALVPLWWLSVALTAVSFAAFSVVLPVTAVALLSVVAPRLRQHASLLLGLAVLGGAVIGQTALGTIGQRFGVRWILLVTAFVGFTAVRGLGRAARTLEDDLDGAIKQVIDEETLRVAVSRGQHLPQLSCRGIDFSYGQLQVLFDVNLAIDEGEMVALLGTNGAGKSTLLRVISGLGFPDRGTVQYRGSDITYLDASRRVALGISQIPGGRAVFGPMTVLDNLRVYGFTHGKEQKAIERGIDATFEAFPRLAERRNQLASTLSGGEQQMLGLAKAMILRPRLLLIDELTLGLAPTIIADLLAMVRRINAGGTTIVLVEQSVNIALALVDHAYFMEKGEVRFDGRAADLLARPDILRSVFLEGMTGVPT